MPLTVIDPVSALVVIDLQAGVVGVAGAPHSVPDVIDRSARLARAFRARGLPVVLVNVTGGAPGRTDADQSGGARASRPEGWEVLVPELDVQPDDILITKRTWGAFHGTALADELAARAVTQVVVTGIATAAGVESTARSAHEHGYNVVLATDAMTDRSAELHENSVTRVFPRLGETATTDEILELLGGAATV